MLCGSATRARGGRKDGFSGFLLSLSTFPILCIGIQHKGFKRIIMSLAAKQNVTKPLLLSVFQLRKGQKDKIGYFLNLWNRF